MPTKTPREKIKEILLKLESAYDQWNIDDGWIFGWEQCIIALETLIEEARQEAREEMITYISKHQWWEETEDNYRERFWFAPKYSSL